MNNIENSMCHDITTDKFDNEYFAYSCTNTIEKPKYKSIMILGNVNIYNTKRFNWFNKLMFKLCFGIIIKDIKYKKE